MIRLPDTFMPDPADAELDKLIQSALAEDLGDGDVTTLYTIPAEARYTGDFLMKATGVVAGLRVAARVFVALDPAVQFSALAADGARVKRGDIVATVIGPGRAHEPSRDLQRRRSPWTVSWW